MTTQDSFQEYCLRYYGDLRHPFSDQTEPTDPNELNASVALLQSILELDAPPRQFKGLEAQFYSAFESYVATARNETGSLCNAVDRLAGLIEPFCKKIAFSFLPGATVVKNTPQGEKSVLLWKTPNYADVLEALGILAVRDLHREAVGFWQQQPPHLALLRAGFEWRQKGTHESRIHTLQQLEEVAYSVIGQYLIVCLQLLQNPDVTAKVKAVTEKARVTFLLRERSHTYSLTGTLLSRREHLLLYRHRERIEPDQSEKRFLFLNYLADRGPCFYWLRNGSPETLQWAEQFYTTWEDESVKKGAVRYILEHGGRVPLEKLIAMWSAYNEKSELARYMSRCATPQDIAQLLTLADDKREEVALEACALLQQLVGRLDGRLKKLARSPSESKLRLLQLLLPRIARHARLGEYRRFARVNDISLRIAYVYCLGEVGTPEDLRLIEEMLAKQRIDRRLRKAGWYAVARIASRLGQKEKVLALLRNRDSIACVAALDAVTRAGLGPRLDALVRQIGRSREKTRRANEAILRIATKADRDTVRSVLRRVNLGNDNRPLVLALGKVGTPSDCWHIIRSVRDAKDRVDLYNHVRIAESIGSLCGVGLRRRLRRYLESPEFWGYIDRTAARPKNRLPVKNIDNQALMRRLLGACFVKVAGPADVRLLKRLLSHNYDWIARKAAEKIGELGHGKDIEELNERLLAMSDLDSSEAANVLEALCILDRKTYGKSP
jgi:hypothetical protein